MLILALAVGGALKLALWFLPIRLRAQVRQDSWELRLILQFHIPLFTLCREICVTEALGQALVRPKTTPSPQMVPHAWEIVRQPLAYLVRRTRCSRLAVTARIGGRDAYETALLSGLLWLVAGMGAGLFSSFVRTAPAGRYIAIAPDFQRPAYHLRTDCILHMQVGHAIVAAVWLWGKMRRSKRGRAAHD